ncbi:MAG: ribonuclease J [Rhodospirillaceae bacterium]|nr:ribonuclease J [Rhodospirillaceae bacterium]
MSLHGTPKEDELLFLPLGGSDEIGMNLNLYHYGGKWLMVDLGISFADDTMPGVDVIMPDPSFVEERRHDVVGLLLTHAHEDHLGAVQYLWDRIRCPIYATPFTASVLRRKLADADLLSQIQLIEVPLKDNFVIGPFEIELIGITHSIPEPNAVAIRTGAGVVLHTGDWKFDPEPVIGEVTDYDKLRDLGDEGILALVGDSTNVLVPGQSGSEAGVERSMTELFAQFDGKIAVTCFASNVGRVQSVARAAEANDRHAVLVGRSMLRMVECAKENGYLKDLPEFVSDNDAGFLPSDKVVLICTGSQGESRAALARIADGSHQQISLGEGDTVIFSSREIPGNEPAIAKVQNRLVGLGVQIVTERDAHVHVSGHPCQDEMVEMYQYTRPEIAVPVHGDAVHLMEHAKLARRCQVPETVVPGNGSMIRLAPGKPEIIGWIDTAMLALDGDRLRPVGGDVIRERRKMLHNGTAAVTVVLNGKGQMVAAPQISFAGICDALEAPEVSDEASDLVTETIEAMSNRNRGDDDRIEEAAGIAVRRMVRARYGKRPITNVHVVRV